jgi:SulP family sulfate permease
MLDSARRLAFRYIPAFDSLRSYSLTSLRKDLFAGATVAAVAVPQAMAYALIFGMPVEMGLYTAIVMTTVGALFDSSKQLINGPTNAISIAMLSALAIVPEDGRVAAAIMMALFIGVIQTAIALFRFGDLSRFISHAVIVGFTLGASILLLLDQLKNVLGLKSMGTPHDHFLYRFWLSMTSGGSIHYSTLAVATGTIALALIFRALNKRFRLGLPELLLSIVVCSAVLAYADPSKSSGVKLLEHVPRALPSFQLPHIDWGLARELSGSAAAVAFLGLLEAMAMAKSIAAKTGQKLNMNQQCLSEGLANIAGSFFRCFPGSGSLTRSYINHTSGAVTQWSGVFSAVGVAMTILVLAPLAQYIPKAALAGVLILTATRMTDLSALRYYWKATRYDALILTATALSAVLISVEFCILIGVVLSFAFYVPRAAHISMTELTITSDRVVREVQPGDARCGLVRIYNLEGELFFGSSTEFERLLENVLQNCPLDMEVVILRLKRTRNPDAVCMELLQSFIEQLHARGTSVMLSGVRSDLARVMSNLGIDKLVGPENLFAGEAQIWAGTIEAMHKAYDRVDKQKCQHCIDQESQGDKVSDWSYII